MQARPITQQPIPTRPKRQLGLSQAYLLHLSLHRIGEPALDRSLSTQAADEEPAAKASIARRRVVTTASTWCASDNFAPPAVT